MSPVNRFHQQAQKQRGLDEENQTNERDLWLDETHIKRRRGNLFLQLSEYKQYVPVCCSGNMTPAHGEKWAEVA